MPTKKVIFTDNYKFFSHKECEYYPCHKMKGDLNCLFCYCPLYLTDCPGNPKWITVGSRKIKDCSDCVFPHIGANYDAVIRLLSEQEF